MDTIIETDTEIQIITVEEDPTVIEVVSEGPQGVPGSIASAVVVSPISGLTATNVQTALEELYNLIPS